MGGILKYEKTMLSDRGRLHVNRKNDNMSFGVHWHSYYEIILYRRCAGTVTINGKPYAFDGDFLHLMTPADYHTLAVTPGEGAESLVVSFSEDMIDGDYLRDDRLSATALSEPSEQVCRMTAELWRLFVRKHEPFRETRMRQLLNAVLGELLACGSRAGAENDLIHPVVRKTILLMLERFSEDLTLPEAAKECGVSPSYLSCLLHGQTGKTFPEWLNDLRVSHAKRLLEDTDLTSLEIALECGYNTPSHFIRVFRRLTGRTPTAYRTEKKERASDAVPKKAGQSS